MRKAALACLASLLLAACGGGGGGSGGADAGGAGGDGSPASASTPTSAPAGGATTAPTSAAAGGPALRDIATRSNAAPFKVSYKFSTNAGGQAVDVTQTWYQSGSRFRMDLTTPQAGGGGTFSFFSLPEGSFSCGTFGGAGAQCTSFPAAQAGAQSPGFQLDTDLRANADRYGAAFTGTRQVAGVTGQCFGFNTAAAGFQRGTACYSSNGIPLYMQFDVAGGSFTMEATSVGTPTDADFRLPATPR